jgi:hypothetical protein
MAMSEGTLIHVNLYNENVLLGMADFLANCQEDVAIGVRESIEDLKLMGEEIEVTHAEVQVV